MGWLRLRRLRDRRLCPTHRGLEGQHSATAGFVLDALEQAIHARGPDPTAAWSITATGAFNILPWPTPSALPRPTLNPLSAASGISYDNALAETINGLYKAEVIWRQRPGERIGR
jgi:transposase InsO family protein